MQYNRHGSGVDASLPQAPAVAAVPGPSSILFGSVADRLRSFDRPLQANLPTADPTKKETGRAEGLSRFRHWLHPTHRRTRIAGAASGFSASEWSKCKANIIEDDESVRLSVRLQVGDLPILWTDAREYNPDFIAVERDGSHWVIEAKMDREMASADVQGKRQAARRWANYVSADEKVGTTWRYLLVSESDVKNASGSWEAMKGLANR